MRKLTKKYLINSGKYFLTQHIGKRYAGNLPYYPLSIAVEVTTKCNLGCSRCEREVVSPETLNQDTAIETIRKIAPVFDYVNSISFVSGLGEPFLNPSFWEMHQIVKSHGAKVSYFTNGQIFTEELARRTIEEKTDHVFFSVDSSNKETYEKIKNRSSFDKTLRAVNILNILKRDLKSKTPHIVFNYAFQASTIDEMPSFIKFAAGQGVSMVWFTGVIPHQEKFADQAPFNIERQKMLRIFDEVRKEAYSYEIDIRLPTIHSFKNPQICEDPWQCMFIFYNGDVCACPHFREEKEYYFYVKDKKLVQDKIKYPKLILGNVNQENILELWNNEKYQELRKGLKAGTASAPCNTCYYPYGWH